MERLMNDSPCQYCNKNRQEDNSYPWIMPCYNCPDRSEWITKQLICLSLIKDILGDDYDLSRLRELLQADRDGRCVVLSEPMVPMLQKVGDTDVYCPNCGKTLSGGWPLAEADDYRKLCQCPNCGQAIDDTKCEIVYEVTRGEKHG